MLTDAELRALSALLVACAMREREGRESEQDRNAKSALAKLLDMPSGLTCCYHERARIITLLHEQLLDETPTNRDPSPLAMVRDAGYRGGWNDRARSLRAELLK